MADDDPEAETDDTPNVYHYSVFAADRDCAKCGDPATAYIHGEGNRCGDCHPDAPDQRRDAGTVSSPD